MTDAELLDWVGRLVHDNAERVVGADAHEASFLRLSLSRRLHHNGERHHRLLTVRYALHGTVHERQIWLKFLSAGRSRFDAHEAIWRQRGGVCDLFPRPYFYGERDGTAVVGMEAIRGAGLRTLFLRHAVGRRTGALNAVFSALGASLRAFHDSSEPARTTTIAAVEDAALHAAAESQDLRADERRRIAEHIAAAAARAGPETVLPLTPLHHDCVLRNVLVRPSGSPALVDLDSLRAPPKSRWYDVAGFLINLESQIKYEPLVGASSIAIAWGAFAAGYLGAGLPDGLAPDQVDAILYQMKVQYLLGIQRRPIGAVHTSALARRYLARLRAALVNGEHMTLPACKDYAALTSRRSTSGAAATIVPGSRTL